MILVLARNHNTAWSFIVLCIALFTGYSAQAQFIGDGNLSMLIDGAYVLNGYPNSTGAPVVAGTALTGTVQVTGVTGNGGSTEVICTEQLTGATLLDWTTETDGSTSFSWTPTTAATFQISCSGTWYGYYAIGTVYTGTAFIPVTGSLNDLILRDTESVRSSTATANSMSAALKTSDPRCGENVNIFEDTIYRTFVYQVPTSIAGCP